jgi:hypothetical protein
MHGPSGGGQAGIDRRRIPSVLDRLPPGLLPSVTLVLLAPLVGEFLLGNITIRDIAAWPFLAPSTAAVLC